MFCLLMKDGEGKGSWQKCEVKNLAFHVDAAG